MGDLGLEQLQTEPCCWRCTETDGSGEKRLVGLAVAHVDEFLFGGDQTSVVWQRALQGIYDSYQWSPWEIDSYFHCGIQIIQAADGSTTLNHSDYCESIGPIKFERREESHTDRETTTARCTRSSSVAGISKCPSTQREIEFPSESVV